MILEEPEVVGDDPLCRCPLQPEAPELEQQALLQVARRHTGRIESLHQLQRALHFGDRPRSHRRQFIE